jgi:hypothetical protein
MAVSPTGDRVAAGGWAVALWDLATEQRTSVAIAEERFTAYCLAFSADGKHLVAGMFAQVEDSGLWAWDAATGQRSFSRCRVVGRVWALAVAPTGGAVAVASPEGQVTVLALDTGKAKWQWSPPWEEFAHDLAFSPDGRRLALASMQSVWLFDAQRGRPLTKWQTHAKHHVNAVCFSPSGRLLATGGNDRTVTFWDVAELDEKAPPPCAASYDWGLGKVRGVAFAPDGMTATAVGDNRKVVVWDVERT